MKTIDVIRRERLSMLKTECGGVGKLAEQIEKSPSQVSQWLNASTHSGTGKGRGMSDDICRFIETKFEKPVGWMDADPDRVDASVIKEILMNCLDSTEGGIRQILESSRAAEKIRR